MENDNTLFVIGYHLVGEILFDPTPIMTSPDSGRAKTVVLKSCVLVKSN